MKKFIKKMVLLIAILAIICIPLNETYIKLDKRDPGDIKKFADIPNELQVCNFGSSHGLYGYNYEDLSRKYNCFNFGLSSQTLTYDYRLFNNYKDHIGKGTVVFITVSYFVLFGKAEEKESEFLSKNKRYYSILPPNLIKEYDLSTDFFCKFPILSADYDTAKDVFLGKTEEKSEKYWRLTALDIDVEEDAKNAVERHIIDRKFDKFGKRIVNQQEVNALLEMINGCKERGAIPILITTPYLSEYTSEVKKCDPNFYKDFYKIIDQVKDETGVKYYDYAFDKRFCNNYSWFLNSDHLNKEGAKEFVEILMNEVK